jgi:proteasome activator subunit 4
VSALAIPLLSRSLFPAGGKHLIPLLDLCIPGIDVNDPAKTMNTALFILHGFSVIKVDDLTQADTGDIFDYEGGAVASTAGDGVDGEGKEISEAIKEENRLLRESTASFPDWVDRFFRQILALFDALPERGRGNRTGGKAEEGMTTFVLVSGKILRELFSDDSLPPMWDAQSACDIVCSSLSDRLFDLAFGIFFDYVSTTVRSNSINVVDHLCLCFARANPAKVLAKIVPLTVKRVTKELEYGACSIRTTSTSPTDDTDLTFSWFAGLLYAAVKPAGKEVSPVQLAQRAVGHLEAFLTCRRPDSGVALQGGIDGPYEAFVREGSLGAGLCCDWASYR